MKTQTETPEETFTAAEISEVRELNDYLDDPPISNSLMEEALPEVEKLLSVAWWLTEDFIRENTGKCSSTTTLKDEHAPQTEAPFTCQCCRYFRHISGRARHLRGLIR